MCRNAKCVGGIGKPEEIYASINKKRSSGLTSAQRHREILGLPETHVLFCYSCDSEVCLLQSYPNTHFGKPSY